MGRRTSHSGSATADQPQRISHSRLATAAGAARNILSYNRAIGNGRVWRQQAQQPIAATQWLTRESQIPTAEATNLGQSHEESRKPEKQKECAGYTDSVAGSDPDNAWKEGP